MNPQNINGWQLLKLIYALRSAGMDITLQQIQDVLNAQALFPDLEEKAILEAFLITRHEDRELFHLVYGLLNSPDNFHEENNMAQNNSSLEQCNQMEQTGCNGNVHQGIGTGRGGITLLLQAPGDTCQASSFQMPDLQALIGLKGFPGTVDEIEEQEQNLEKQIRFILGQAGFLTWANSMELAKARGRIAEPEWEKFEEYKRYWNQQIRQVLLQERLDKQNKWEVLREVNWRYKPLNSFSAEETGIVHQALRKMGKTLAVRPGFRRKKASRGKINVSSLLKEMVRGGGKIFQLRYETPVLKHPELIVLCDVSNSVAPFSQSLLYLCQKIRFKFRKVRLFLFIDAVWEVTREPWLDTEESQEEIRTWGRKHSSGFSDYGKVFKDFALNVLPELSSQGTVLIMGDGRSNFRPAQVEYLQSIQEKVKHIYWLNPLDPKDWHKADNLINEYKQYCTQVFPCRNINDLWYISKRIFT